jgi:hypothetical protein
MTFNRQQLKAHNIIARWEKRYPGRQDVVDFLVQDELLSSRSAGKIAYFKKYLSLPRQLEMQGLGPLPLPIHNTPPDD